MSLLKTALNIRNIPLLGGYIRNFSKGIMRPIKRHGALGGMWDITKNQIVPKSYSASLKDEIIAARKNMMGLAKKDKAILYGRAEREAYANAAKNYKELIQRKQMADSPSFYKDLFGKQLKKDPWGATKDIFRVGRHYGIESLKPIFMAGMPAYSAAMAFRQPEGLKASTFGEAVGSGLGSIATMPLGILPVLGGATLGSSLGSYLGRKLSGSNNIGELSDKLKSYTPAALDNTEYHI